MRPPPRIRAPTPRACTSRVLAAASSLLAAVILPLALAPAAAAQAYFTAFFAEGGTGIERAGFDGGHLQSLAFQPIGFADGIALDVAAGKMYWTETSAGAIWRANLNGSEAQIIVIEAGREPLGIALDLAHKQMYWTDTEGVKRAKLDGTGTELLAKEPALGFIALDVKTQQMFWADWPSSTIRVAPMTASPLVTTVAKGQPCAFGIAVDEAHREIYWLGLEVREKPKCEKNPAIERAKLDGTAVETIVKRPIGAGFEGGLAVDPVARRIYWTEAEAHDIRAANLDGSGESVLFGTGGDFPIGLAVESADARPVNTAAPSIEGNAAVGSPLYCNAGSWTGVGPISFGYQWALAGGAAIEDTTTSTFVAPSELAGAGVRCEVTAADAIETTVAVSSTVAIAPYPVPSPAAPARQPLIAGIAVEHLSARGSSFRVPIFTSLAGVATLEATPVPVPRKARASRRASHRPPARPRGHGRPQRHASGRIRVTRAVNAGRGVIVLSALRSGVQYALRLTVESADGQTATSSATLRVARR